jgi:hypothetical protein
MALTAIPDSGWTFDHWVISGGPVTGHGGSPYTATPTDNPLNISHGSGFTYAYQPVFDPPSSGTTSPTPTPTTAPGSTMGISNETWIIVLAVVLVIVVIAFGAYAYTKRSKK